MVEEPEKKRVNVTIKGKVQGIGYRAFARAKAIPLLIRGYARNLPGGDVEVVAEGLKKNLEKFITELHKGPALAVVEDLNIKWEDYKGEFTDFEIRY